MLVVPSHDLISLHIPRSIMSLCRSDASKTKRVWVKREETMQEKQPVSENTLVHSSRRERGRGNGKLIPSPNFYVRKAAIRARHLVNVDSSTVRMVAQSYVTQAYQSVRYMHRSRELSAFLDHLVRYLSTWNGSDKFFMVIQYLLTLLVPALNLRARLRHQAGLAANKSSLYAGALLKAIKLLDDSRTLWRMWGILPTLQWLLHLQRLPSATHRLLTIERLQGWAMLLYYPLEHLAYLTSQGVVNSQRLSHASRRTVSKANQLWDSVSLRLWSMRFWSVHIVLQLVHLWEDRKLLQLKERAIRKLKGPPHPDDRKELSNSWDAHWSEVVSNLSYLPLTLHWSVRQGFLGNDVWVGILGLTAAMASFRSGWKATALPQQPHPIDTSVESPDDEGIYLDDEAIRTTKGYDVVR